MISRAQRKMERKFGDRSANQSRSKSFFVGQRDRTAPGDKSKASNFIQKRIRR